MLCAFKLGFARKIFTASKDFSKAPIPARDIE
jgi:hypothetical protein